MNDFKKILVLAPHVDDGELGCGGTIARFISEGKEVYYMTFSTAQASVRPEFPKNILEKEVKEATKMLGIPPEKLIVYNYPVRDFLSHRQEILENLVKANKEIDPDLVLTPSFDDIHQDHQVITREALRAFKKKSILGYEQPWNNIAFKTRCFVSLSKENIQKKISALNCYNSQKHRSYLSEEFIRSLAKTRGVQFEGDYAEAFEIVRMIFN